MRSLKIQLLCVTTAQHDCSTVELLKCRAWLLNSTFPTFLRLFSQLWNIHRQIGSLVLYLVYYFLPEKNQDTYICALTILKNKLHEVLPIIEEEPMETRGRKKKTPSQDEDTFIFKI
ncbi:hypothetical protein DSO57_1021999 [Entomophthora muscae]|uniref:Uncharacterized protein n=1 Tax=Entomophthora muscae TaxID=34485 RepID=A0ACC2U1K1_9FUNG|nr:hypothetical protein DSO57_1021999 [Entomophthora muscae]